jgi:hypothetical protein
MSKKYNRLQYLLHHPTWRPIPEGSIELLLVEGAKITIQEYKHNYKSRCFFCPRCGYPCARIPYEALVNAAETGAYFRHYKGTNPRSCPFWTPIKEGKNYTKISISQKTIEDSLLVEIYAWRLEVDRIEYEHELIANEYHGIHEDKRGRDSNELISRHKANNVIHRSRITSVQYIANVLSEISYKHIILPGQREAFLFDEIFIHASEITSKKINFNALYWGKVQLTCIVDNYLCIAFGYEKYCIYFAYPLRHASQRRWNADYLYGKNIIVAGTPLLSKKFQAIESYQGGNRICLKIEAEAWGAAGVVPRDNERFLEDFGEAIWVDPPVLSTSTTKSSSSSVESQESWNDFEHEDTELNIDRGELSLDLAQNEEDDSEGSDSNELGIEIPFVEEQNQQLNSSEPKQSINHKKHVTVIHEWPSELKSHQTIKEELGSIAAGFKLLKSSDIDWCLTDFEMDSMYLDEERVTCSELNSLFLIARQLERYLDQFIQIPGMSKPKPFLDVFCHVHDLPKRHNHESNIYWGLISSTEINDGAMSIKFNSQDGIIIIKISESVLKAKYWTQKNLKGKLMMFAGQAQEILSEIPIKPDFAPLERKDWLICVDSPKQAAIIKSDTIESVKLLDGRSWRELENPDTLMLYDRSRISRNSKVSLAS